MFILFISDLFKIQLIDVIDILLVAILLYQFYNLIKGTNAINIFIGILSYYIIWKIVKALHMELLQEILGAFISVGFIALIVVFQPEIRRFLFLLGTPNFINKQPKRFFFWRFRLVDPIQLDLPPILNACKEMSKSKTGALIVLAHLNELKQYTHTGEQVDAKVTDQLLQNIFFKNSPLHDGAVIIIENRIKAARCVLPVSENQELPVNLGLRHRAAVGITENSDAVAIIVSEQTGAISFCKSGELQYHLNEDALQRILEEEFIIKNE